MAYGQKAELMVYYNSVLLNGASVGRQEIRSVWAWRQETKSSMNAGDQEDEIKGAGKQKSGIG